MKCKDYGGQAAFERAGQQPGLSGKPIPDPLQFQTVLCHCTLNSIVLHGEVEKAWGLISA